MRTKASDFVSISTGTIIRFLAVAAVIWVLFLIRDIVGALILAVVVASAVEPAIGWLRDRGVPRILGTILIYLVIAFILAIAVYFIFPVILEDFRQLLLSYPVLQKSVFSGFAQTGILSKLSEDLLRPVLGYLQEIAGGFLNFAAAVFGGAFSFLLVVIFSFYMAAQEKGIENFLRLVSPLKYESYIIDLWERSQRKLGRWVRAQLLLGVLVGVMIFIGLTILAVERALFYAVFVGIFELIPVVGPILGAIPAVVAAFLISPLKGILVIALYTIVQQVESNVIVPVVMRRAIGLNPLVVVVALLIGAKLGGIFGIILSIPLTAILAELVEDWDKKKRVVPTP